MRDKFQEKLTEITELIDDAFESEKELTLFKATVMVNFSKTINQNGIDLFKKEEANLNATSMLVRICDYYNKKPTGLKDSEGNEIQEGDLLEFEGYPGEDYYMEIAVDDEPPHNFIYGYRVKAGSDVRGISHGIYNVLENEKLNWKIIGNIHDNPELLR